MRKVSSLFLPLCFVGATALAQSVSLPASDQWQPAAATSVAPHATTTPLPGNATTAAKPSPFKFKGERKAWMDEPPPPRANDKAAVMGKQRPWQDGRPPVDCAVHPRAAGCP